MRPRTLLADDHPMIVEGLRYILRDRADVIGTYGDGAALLRATLAVKPDLVVTDISMPEMTGMEYVRVLRQVPARPRVIVLSVYDDRFLVQAALRQGVQGFLTKESVGDELIAAVDSVMKGMQYLSSRLSEAATSSKGDERILTRRQLEVVRLVAAGKRMKEIATELHLSRRTVEMHKYRVMRALGLRTTAELIQYYVQGTGGFADQSPQADAPRRTLARKPDRNSADPRG